MPPNLLFIFSDQQHWQAVGFEDASFKTPHLDRFAKESAVFTQPFCTTPQCSPSRSSMLTGLYPAKTGVMGNVGMAGGEPLRMPTIGGLLQQAGYRTAYFGKWHLGNDPRGTGGWDEEAGIASPQPKDEETTRLGQAFLGKAGHGARPFALFLSYNNPHDVYHFGREKDPAPMVDSPHPETWHKKDLSTTPSVQKQFMTDDQGKAIWDKPGPAWARYREIYREKTALYDKEVGAVFAELERLGLKDSTLIVVTSDHGDMDTQHRLIYKGPFMYEHMMRVPLMIRTPDGKGSRSIDFQTVNVDLVPTLADYAGAVAPKCDGVSLRPLLEGREPAARREYVFGQYYSKQKWVNPIRMVRSRAFKYNLYRAHGEELYDLQHDPGEIHNLAGVPAHAETKARLAAELGKWMEANDDPFYTQNPTTRDGQPLR